MSIASEILNMGLRKKVYVTRYIGIGFGKHRFWKKVSQETFEKKHKFLDRFFEHKLEFYFED